VYQGMSVLFQTGWPAGDTVWKVFEHVCCPPAGCTVPGRRQHRADDCASVPCQQLGLNFACRPLNPRQCLVF
jgi:hypothetical protein